MAKLKRSVGLLGATSVGIANIIGAGIFVLSGVAAGLAGPAVILSFVVAGFVAMLTAFSTAELSSFITETGAAYAFTKIAFGRFWGFLVGWFKYFDYIVGAAAVSVGFAAYFVMLFGLSSGIALLATAITLPLVFTALNIIGIRETAMVTSAMVMIKLFALTLLLLFGGYYLANNFNIAHYTPFFATGVTGMFNGAAIVFFAFLGFNTVSMLSEETKNPKKTIPKALIAALIVSFVFYIGIAAVEVGVLDWKTLGASASPLADLASAISQNRMFFDFVSFSALIATGSVLLSSIIGGTRASFAMGRDRLLPRPFEYISKRFGTPYVSIIVGGLIITALSAIFFNNIDEIAAIVNFGTLFTYFFVHISLIKLRKIRPNIKRFFKVPFYPAFPILGAISCILMMVYLSNLAKTASLVWGVVGVLIYAVYGKRRKLHSRQIL